VDPCTDQPWPEGSLLRKRAIDEKSPAILADNRKRRYPSSASAAQKFAEKAFNYTAPSNRVRKLEPADRERVWGYLAAFFQDRRRCARPRRGRSRQNSCEGRPLADELERNVFQGEAGCLPGKRLDKADSPEINRRVTIIVGDSGSQNVRVTSFNVYYMVINCCASRQSPGVVTIATSRR